MELHDFQWQEREGRNLDDSPFHEWTFQHLSGRILAVVTGPADRRGGFMHEVNFLFHRETSMQGAPFLFTDFDSGKRFAESVLASKITGATPEGGVSVAVEANPQVAIFAQAMEKVSGMMNAGVIRAPGGLSE